jgi:hypothetical protein
MKKEKNVHAQALGALGGRARAKALTAERQSEIGKIANFARNQALTAAERQELAKRAARARWKRK